MPRAKRPFTPGLRQFLTRVITPAVLVGGIIFLIFFNFNSVLKATKVTDDHFHGDVAFSQGSFALRFQENAGIDRPALSYAGQDLISYSEWGSTASIDGNVQEIWNNSHGYEYDEKANQIYSTVSGKGWQLTQIVTLVNDHTVTVTFKFDAQPDSLPGPDRYIFDIAHVTSPDYQWYNCQVKNNTFSGQVMSGNGPQAFKDKPQFYGILSLMVAGPAVHAPSPWIKNGTALVGKKDIVLGQEFFTEYEVNNPSPDVQITLGTETLTFRSGANSPDAPLPLPVQGSNSAQGNN